MSDDLPENEQLLQFPCSFPVKVMGRDKPGFRDAVIGVVRAHADDIDESAIREAPSRKGSFVSVTVTVNAKSQQQLDSIYRDLTNHEDVLFSL